MPRNQDYNYDTTIVATPTSTPTVLLYYVRELACAFDCVFTTECVCVLPQASLASVQTVV